MKIKLILILIITSFSKNVFAAQHDTSQPEKPVIYLPKGALVEAY